jgi:hypothetical protein
LGSSHHNIAMDGALNRTLLDPRPRDRLARGLALPTNMVMPLLAAAKPYVSRSRRTGAAMNDVLKFC